MLKTSWLLCLQILNYCIMAEWVQAMDELPSSLMLCREIELLQNQNRKCGSSEPRRENVDLAFFLISVVWLTKVQLLKLFEEVGYFVELGILLDFSFTGSPAPSCDVSWSSNLSFLCCVSFVSCKEFALKISCPCIFFSVLVF